MTFATLTRWAYCADVTLGLLAVPGGDGMAGLAIYTAEDAWRANRRHVSCIPDGEYEVRPRRYNRGGYDAFGLQDVPGRSDILIHKGNSDEHVEGCIVVGLYPACIPGLGLSVAQSAQAFAALYRRLGGQVWRLVIRAAPGLDGARLDGG